MRRDRVVEPRERIAKIAGLFIVPMLLPAIATGTLLSGIALAGHAAQPNPGNIPGSGSRTFPETGKTVRGLFLDYWSKNGGLAQQGFPISDPLNEVSDLNGKPYTVQYFERAVLEYHPENQPPYNVLLSQLGTFQYRGKYPNSTPGQKPNNTSGSQLFSQTGKRVGGPFLSYWQSHGGLAQQGYPISDEFIERSDLNGKEYLVQYFERAVFEYHPENQPPYNVLLSQLGTFRYRAKYTAQPVSSPTPAMAPEGMVDVGGYKLYYSCTGQGSPTVIMDAGLGENSSTWAGVGPDLAKLTRVCVYDRAGLGKSGKGPRPRTSMQIAKELHTLLTNAKILGPYVVVGHSQGGLNMLMFAELYRSEVVGIVSIDGAPPDMAARYQAVLTPDQFKQYQALLSLNREGITFDELRTSGDQVRAAAPLPDVPLTVLVHGLDQQYPAGWPVAALEKAWRDAQQAVAKSTPQGKLVIAQNSGHFIYIDQPQLVIDSVNEIVSKARGK